MSKDSPSKSSESDWYRSKIDRLLTHNEAMTAALIQINASLIQLCARIADNARPNEAQMLLGLLPLLSKEGEKPDDPKVIAQLQRLAETLKKEPEKKT
jgi:hypothetical protein